MVSSPGGGRGAHRPGAAQHRPVHRGCALGAPEAGSRAEAPQRRVARQRVLPAKAPRRLAGEQLAVREEVATGELQLDYRPVALTARVAAGTDGAQSAPVRLGHKAEPVEQLAPQHDAADGCDVVLGSLDDWSRDPPRWARRQLVRGSRRGLR
jgi:hypothetical protein